MACPVTNFNKPDRSKPSIVNKFILKWSKITQKWPLLIKLCKIFGVVGIIWSLRAAIRIYKKYQHILPGPLSLALLSIIGTLYVAYHCIAVHRYLQWHDSYVEKIIKRAKMKRENGIQAENILNYTYSECVSQEQFNANMKYFEKNRDAKGGFYPNQRIMETFSESCTFLGGARAALLQVAHPFVAISVRKHSYILKKSKTNLTQNCDYRALSAALKSRFNRTFAVLFPMIYGPLPKSIKSARRAWYWHKQIHGQLLDDDSEEIIGDGTLFNKKTKYSATMTVPLRWVWATLVEGTIFTQQLMGCAPYQNLNDTQIEFMKQCYAASVNTAMAFGLNDKQIPKTLPEFEEYYWFDMMQSKHIAISKDCSRWCKVFFMVNNWYSKPAAYALKCYTSVIFPQSVRMKFNQYDETLLPMNRFIYCYALLWLGSFRAIYMLLPKSVRLLNDYMEFNERVNGTNYYSKLEKLMKVMSGHVANFIVYAGIEG